MNLELTKTQVMNLELTKTQVMNLLEFFELDFIDSIRNDPELENINYLCDMCDIYKKLKELLEEIKEKRSDTE